MQALTIRFYTDTDFNPTTNRRVALSRTGNYLYSFKTYGVGIGINDYSYFLKVNFDLTDIILTNPTCFTVALSGSSVSGSTVKMDGYTPAQTKDGAIAVPFDITLQNCIRVHNIETKFKSNKVGSASKELLADTLTGDDATRGVSVLIEGLKNTKNAQMVLKPNDATSIYKDYETEDDTAGGVYPDKRNSTPQPLHFQATSKQDSNIAIGSGDFKATSIFQITYP